jgi:phosphoglycolate phosphatase
MNTCDISALRLSSGTPRLVLLDFDGTLVDSEPGVFASYRHVLDALGLQADDTALRACLGPHIRHGFAGLGVRPDQIDQAVVMFRAWYAEHGIFDCRLYDGTAEMLERLTDAGVPLGLATIKLTTYARRLLAYLAIEQHFSVVEGSTPDRSVDGKTDIVARALDSAGVAGTQRVVMVGDHPHDMRAAVANDLVPIGAGWGYSSRADLLEAGARGVVDSPAELAELLVGEP